MYHICISHNIIYMHIMVIIIYCMNQMYLTGYFIKLHTKVLNLYNYFYLFVAYYILLYIVDWQTYCIFVSYNKQHYTDVIQIYVIIHLRPLKYIQYGVLVYVYYYLIVVKFNYISMDQKLYDYLTIIYGILKDIGNYYKIKFHYFSLFLYHSTYRIICNS